MVFCFIIIIIIVIIIIIITIIIIRHVYDSVSVSFNVSIISMYNEPSF